MTIRRLNKALQEKACRELHEDPEKIQDDLENLKEWIQTQPDLNAKMDDQGLLAFLRGCKFNSQRTQEKLLTHYTTRTLLPELFANRDPLLPEIQAVLESGAVLPLPVSKDSKDPRAIFFRWSVCNPETMSVRTLTKVYFMILDILIYECDNTAVAGHQCVSEFTGFNVRYILQLTPLFLRRAVTCLQSVYPVRIKGIYCTNAPVLFEAIFNIARRFMTKKLKHRAFMYSKNNSSAVYSHVPQAVFPKEYEGDNESIVTLTAEWKKKVESYRDWLLKSSTCGSIETFEDESGQSSPGSSDNEKQA